MKVGTNGWVSGMRRLASPNCDSRPAGTAIDLLVIHNISLPPGEFGGLAVAQLFTNTLDTDAHPFYAQLNGVRVSAHFLIQRTGEIIQFVPCGKRAWHAGASAWHGRTACNDFSIGVELEGTDFLPFSDQQYAALIRLTRVLKRAYPVRATVGHSDIAPGRKTDPGYEFDWSRYLAKDYLKVSRKLDM
ncbi:1,6-anhydro-N-acetylmuramoyl-L-alanine amidase [Candidatus Nitrotoga sp. BS]|uniref:1,6-anhydro-N-acetylmuramyl-L-alanine amidase AmpD n=1 Tax=Candidatus Nitrotoga sp. BS TaxID=2890408 RepID=UPI001EF3CFF0|nr:1,6-anhydro-N-acetylmuramyl-L-alanine amidase AmpD [Candidatus Nitrotoga sp. BS]CAH1203016.1 1,6-anhydro-N-acetylmuramoyl-L-alanine amidase [Candidatus Nitrotoga sp. BS]